jgi:integrase
MRLTDKFNILFDNDLGPLHQTAPQERWDTLVRNAGLLQEDGRKRGIHSLIHTFVANCIEMGNNLKHIQMMLGHTSIKTTMDTYGKLLDTGKAKVNAMIE